MNKIRRLMVTILMGMALAAVVACSTAEPAPVAEPEPEPEPAVVDEAAEQPEEPAEQPEEPVVAEEALPPAADLATLPRIAGSGGGLGGGLPEAGGPASTSMMAIDPFSGTVFTLDVTLPTAPTAALVWRQPERTLTAESAAELATRFGFEPVLYREALPADVGGLGLDMARPMPTMPFFVFNGSEQLVLTGSGAFYNNLGANIEMVNALDEGVAIPAAEAFLQERGLLTFEYVAAQSYPGQVEFRRVINGEPSSMPEIYVSMDNDANVQYVSYEVLPDLAELGAYPLIPAEQAWELLQTGRIFENNIPFEFNSEASEFELEVIEDPFADQYQIWTREYEPGDTIELYSYPQAYLPVDGAGEPIVLVNGYQLSASNEELQAVAEAIGRQFRVVGTLSDDGETVVLNEWETFEFVDSLFLEGVIMLGEDGVVLLNTVDGQTYLIPDAPADLEDGLEVFVFAWVAEETGGAYPALNWESIEKRIDYGATPIDEPAVAEPLPVEPGIEPGLGQFSGYEEVVITEVTLGYYTTFQFEPLSEEPPAYDAPPVVVQPVWRFTGTISGAPAEVGTVTFFMQAVDPTLLEAAPQG